MVSFNGIGELTVTMVDSSATANAPCRLSANKTVSAAASGNAIDGVCLWKRDGLAEVQIRGFVTLGYTGDTAPAVGYGGLVSNGNGGVTVSADAIKRLIVDVDTTAKTVTFYL